MRYGSGVSDTNSPVPSELCAFLESGLTLVAATRDRELAPHCAFAVGLRVHPDRHHVTLLLPSRAGAEVIENLRSNGEVAITASRPIDYRTVQLKGRVVEVAVAPEVDREFVLRYRDAFSDHLAQVGMLRSLTQRLTVWPCVAALVAVRGVFEQTPGPRAGSPLGPR
jgi:hypothetical protein